MPTLIGPDEIPAPLAAEAPDGPGAFLAAINALNQVRAGRVVADLNALAALSAATLEGRILNVDEGGANFQSQDGVWVQLSRARFSTSAARDSAYNKASASFLVAGAECYLSGTDVRQVYASGAWRDEKLATGSYSTAPTNTNGDVVIIHGLPSPPPSVQITGGIGGAIPDRRTYAVHSITASQFSVRVYRQDTGGPLLNNPCDFYWSAIS